MASLIPELHYGARTCLRQRMKIIPPTRSFTTTIARRKNGPLPTFPTTSSAELDLFLTTFREKVFLPSHLLRAQRALIYHRRLQHQLTGEEPVTVTLPTTTASAAEETFTLVPLNRLKDEPGTKASFNKFLAMLKTSADWDVLPDFLDGLRGSGRKLTEAMAEKMVRKAAQQGRMGVVMSCALQTDKTALKLRSIGLVREFMLGALQRAIDSQCARGELSHALKQAEMILITMEDPKHKSEKPLPAASDPTKAPDIAGVALALAATRALSHPSEPSNPDQAIKVEKYATRMLQLAEHADLDLDAENWWDASLKLQMWAPARWGMKLAIRVLGEESLTAKRLAEALRADVEPLVSKARADVLEYGPRDRKVRGLKLYEDLEGMMTKVLK